MGPRPLYLLKTGDTMPEIAAVHGDFDRMFLGALDAHAAGAVVVETHRGAPLPDPAGVAGVIITGSPASVTARDPWADALAAWSRAAAEAGVPLLGVCYGHQLLAHAFGGTVVENPKGYEVGTVEVELTDAGVADRVLGPMAAGARTIAVQSTHQDIVVALPPGATLLASNAMTPVQAFAIGDRVRGVQFHPEITAPILRMYAELRAHKIPEHDRERVHAGIRPTPEAPGILRRFVECFVLPRA